MNNKFLLPLVFILLAGGGIFGFLSYSKANNKASLNESITTHIPTATSATVVNNEDSRYVNYDSNTFLAKADKKRVYFFHASWCPTCRQANLDFNQSKSQIPADVVLFKTDYDQESELKKQYGITYQHTFVLVDQNGTEIKKWNGGGMDKLLANLGNE